MAAPASSVTCKVLIIVEIRSFLLLRHQRLVGNLSAYVQSNKNKSGYCN